MLDKYAVTCLNKLKHQTNGRFCDPDDSQSSTELCVAEGVVKESSRVLIHLTAGRVR